jgi:ABC-type branched-subunit amino acid transport system substrate-binding protein/DNA-binding beta-propeller fold protein YncE
MPDRHLIVAVEESDSSVGFYDSLDGREVARVNVGLWPHEVALTRDGALAYVSNFGLKDYDERIGRPGASISIIDVRNKCEIDRLYTVARRQRYFAPHALQLSADERQLFVNVELPDRLLVFDLPSGSMVHSFALAPGRETPAASDPSPDAVHALPEGAHTMLVSPAGDHLWVAPSEEGVVRLNPQTGEATGVIPCGGSIRGMVWMNDGRLVAAGSGQIFLLDVERLRIDRHYPHLGVRSLLYPLVTPAQDFILAPAVWESQVVVVHAATGELVARIPTAVDPIHLLLAPSGSTFYVSHGRSRVVLEIEIGSWRHVRQIVTRGGPNGIAVAPFSDLPPRGALKFGAAIPLSGPSSTEGRDLRMGYQYWTEQVNGAGGILVDGRPHYVELAFEDTRSSVAEPDVRTATQRLIDQHGVQFLLGTYPSPPNEHSGRVAHERRVPLVTASGAAGRIYEQGFEYVFGIMSSAEAFLEGTLLAVRRQTPEPRSIAFVSCEDPAALQDAVSTARIATRMGLEIRVPAGPLPQGATRIEPPGVVVCPHLSSGFEPIATALREVAPDLLFHTGHLPEAVAVVRAARRVNFRPMGLAFSVGPAFPAFADQLQAAAEHLWGAAMWTDVQRTWGQDRFVTPAEFAGAFFERFSHRASYLAAGAVACGLVYEEALRNARTANPQRVRDELRKIDLDLFYSHVEFNHQGLNTDRPLVTIQLRRVDGQMRHIPLWPLVLAGDYTPVWPFPGWPPDSP